MVNRKKLDDLDFFIVSSIDKKDTSTWNIAKNYFQIFPEREHTIEGKKSKEWELRTKISTIQYRLKKLEFCGVIIITQEKNNKIRKNNIYVLIQENYLIEKKRFPDGQRKNICWLKINNKWSSWEF